MCTVYFENARRAHVAKHDSNHAMNRRYAVARYRGDEETYRIFPVISASSMPARCNLVIRIELLLGQASIKCADNPRAVCGISLGAMFDMKLLDRRGHVTQFPRRIFEQCLLLRRCH